MPDQSEAPIGRDEDHDALVAEVLELERILAAQQEIIRLYEEALREIRSEAHSGKTAFYLAGTADTALAQIKGQNP